jgi:hypothetical protein
MLQMIIAFIFGTITGMAAMGVVIIKGLGGKNE